MHYIIHACEDRLWYVQEYLIPSMIDQNIQEDEISVYTDNHCLGNLEACMRIFNSITADNNNSWHIQDDVIISSKFREKTFELNSTQQIICGFSSVCDKTGAGQTDSKHMWWSFPCIMIPNKIAKACGEWWYSDDVQNSKEYQFYMRQRKFDDLIFKIFLEQYYADYPVLNLAPNIVNHIDWLIGGSKANRIRGQERIMSLYWDEDELIVNLEKELKYAGR